MDTKVFKQVALKDIFDISKGYSEVKLNEKILKYPDLKYIKCKLMTPNIIKQYMIYNENIKYKEVSINNIYKKQFKRMEKGDIVFPVISSLNDIQIFYIDRVPDDIYVYSEGLIVLKPKDNKVNTKAIWILLTKTNLKEDIIKLKYNIAKNNRFKQKDNRKVSRLTTQLISKISLNIYDDIEMDNIVKRYDEFEIKYVEFLQYLDKFIVKEYL